MNDESEGEDSFESDEDFPKSVKNWGKESCVERWEGDF